MRDDDFIISGFDSKANEEASFAVDFSSAKPLDRGGSTCDVYEASVQRRRVFVKRLKAEYRDNPLYRAAFNKEYDIGVTLSHPSLPRYVGFGDDYIVLDFIEGDTLADLIKRDDFRLKNKRFVKRLLLELVEGVEYLHNRNIVHCDIKADNIIISPYPDRPVTLIDFDKAHSPWLADTSGDPAKYDCDSCADGRIDFKGIGNIAEKLGLKRFADNCKRENVTADSIKNTLRSPSYRWWIIAALAVVAVSIGFWLRPTEDKKVENEIAEKPEIINKTDGVAQIADVDSAERRVPAQSSITSDKPAAGLPSQTPSPEVSAIDAKWIASLAQKQTKVIDGYKLALLRTLNCDTISIWDKRKAITDYHFSANRAASQVLSSAIEKYRDLPEMEVQTAVRNNPAYERMEKERMDVYLRLTKWNPKESLRPSDLLVSQPDKSQVLIK